MPFEQVVKLATVGYVQLVKQTSQTLFRFDRGKKQYDC